MPSVIEGYENSSIFFELWRMYEWFTTTSGNMKIRTIWKVCMKRSFPEKPPISLSERFTAKAAAECFIHRSKPRNIACTLCAATMVIKRNWNGGVRRNEKIASAKPVATLLRQHGRMPSSAAMPADRKHIGIVLRITQGVNLTPQRKCNGNPNNVTTMASGHADHLQQA